MICILAALGGLLGGLPQSKEPTGERQERVKVGRGLKHADSRSAFSWWSFSTYATRVFCTKSRNTQHLLLSFIISRNRTSSTHLVKMCGIPRFATLFALLFFISHKTVVQA